MANNYIDIVRSLPRPTARQTAVFASYVADAHSWYKHLPVDKTVPFHFFLDPNAGKYLARDAKGQTTMHAIEDTKGHWHYTAQRTDDYLRRLGFWNYDARYGTALLYRVGDHNADTRPIGPRILNNGEWIPVSTEVLELGRAEVNAFVHPHPSIGNWERRLNNQQIRHDLSTGIPRVEFLIKQLLAGKNIMLAPLPSPVQEWIDQQSLLGGIWYEDGLFEKLLDLFPGSEQAKEELFPALLEHLESRRTREELEFILRIENDSDSISNDVVEHFLGLVMPARLQQLRAINSALNRVVNYVYGVTESRNSFRAV
jgi:hypothetical protein